MFSCQKFPLITSKVFVATASDLHAPRVMPWERLDRLPFAFDPGLTCTDTVWLRVLHWDSGDFVLLHRLDLLDHSGCLTSRSHNSQWPCSFLQHQSNTNGRPLTCSTSSGWMTRPARSTTIWCLWQHLLSDTFVRQSRLWTSFGPRWDEPLLETTLSHCCAWHWDLPQNDGLRPCVQLQLLHMLKHGVLSQLY